MSGHNVQGHTHSIRGSVTVRRRDFRPPTAKMHGDSKCSPNYNPLSTFAKVGNSGVLIEHWGGVRRYRILQNQWEHIVPRDEDYIRAGPPQHFVPASAQEQIPFTKHSP